MVRVFGGITKGAKARARAIPPADLNSRRELAADPLPHEDPDFKGQANGPYRLEGRRGGGWGDSRVKGLGGELPRDLKASSNLIRARIDRWFMESNTIKKLMLGGHFRRPKWPPEHEAP